MATKWSQEVKVRFTPDDVADVKYHNSDKTKYKHLKAPAKNRLFIDDHRKHYQANEVELLGDFLILTKTIKPDPKTNPDWVIIDNIGFKFDGDPDLYARMDTKLLARLLAKLGYSYDGEIEALTDNYSEEQPAKPTRKTHKPKPKEPEAEEPEHDLEVIQGTLDTAKTFKTSASLAAYWKTIPRPLRLNKEVQEYVKLHGEALKVFEAEEKEAK